MRTVERLCDVGLAGARLADQVDDLRFGRVGKSSMDLCPSNQARRKRCVSCLALQPMHPRPPRSHSDLSEVGTSPARYEPTVFPDRSAWPIQTLQSAWPPRRRSTWRVRAQSASPIHPRSHGPVHNMATRPGKSHVQRPAASSWLWSCAFDTSAWAGWCARGCEQSRGRVRCLCSRKAPQHQ
jgi:hypothetical protein